MNLVSKPYCRWSRLLSLLAALASMGACDREEYEHEPPAGQGALVVSNFSGDRVRVYVNGTAVDDVTAGVYRYYDMNPGGYRVALDSDDNQVSWADDVDILASRLTVVEVRMDLRGEDFDVRVYFD